MPGPHGRLLTVIFVLLAVAAVAVIAVKVREDGWAPSNSTGSARIGVALPAASR